MMAGASAAVDARPRSDAGSTPPSAHAIAYQPALDGLRGAAVAAVLCFHGGFSWATGGFLGVSTFFTLSGFLITTLLLVERERADHTDLRRFWSRRFRRLMPASLLCLAGIVVFGATVATTAQLQTLRAEMLAALAYVANWQLIHAGTSYADIFTAPSPVQHFWSLAIEEQFYFLFPLAMLGLFALARRTGRSARQVVTAGLVVGLGASLLATFALQGASIDRIYYGTDTRAAELLLGALLAVALRTVSFTALTRRAVGWLGLAALGVTLFLWSQAALTDGWLYKGGLPAFGLVSVAVIVAAVQDSGPVRTVLAVPPLRWLGLISYGVYLFHWPIFLWLTPERLHLSLGHAFVVRVAVTLVVAVGSFVLLERPVRARKVLIGRQALVIAPIAFATVAVGILAVTVPDPNADPTFEQAQDILRSGDFSDAPVADITATTAAPDLAAAGRPAIAMYGDSTALELGLGFGGWIQATDLARGGGGVTELGCGLMPADHFTHFRYDDEADAPGVCADVDQEWTDDIARSDPDIALVMVGPWEVADWRDESTGEWRHIGQPDFDALELEQINHAVDVLSAGGAKVYWLSSPRIEVGTQDGVAPTYERPASNPLRMQRFNTLVAQVAEQRPHDLTVIDLAGYLRSTPGGELDPSLRPDGIHLTWDAATQVSGDWLGPEILRTYIAQQ